MGRSCKREARVIGDAEVKGATGKEWKEWSLVLDEFGVEEKGHSLTVKFLHEHHGLSASWAQEVALYYENDKGLRSLIS